MTSAADSPSIIDEYSHTFTCLQAGKRELIQWGAEAVSLNRFIVDAATATGDTDTGPVLQGIDISQVTHGDNDSERAAYCETALRKLVSLQEEVSVLQKSAREKGISGGLLTIIGQAANQSPEDNGASVLRQLSELVQGEVSGASDQSPSMSVSTDVVSLEGNTLDGNAANDIDRLDLERTTGLQLLFHTLSSHWKPLVVDAGVCAIAACIAISLIN